MQILIALILFAALFFTPYAIGHLYQSFTVEKPSIESPHCSSTMFVALLWALFYYLTH